MENTNTGTKKAIENGSGEKTGIIEKVSETAGKIQEQVKAKTEQLGETAGKAKEKVSDNLATAADTVHTKADSAQKVLDETADKAAEYAHQAINKANQYGHRTADALSSSSEYIKNFDYEETKEQVIETLREKPQIGFALAGILGLIIGLLIGGRRK